LVQRVGSSATKNAPPRKRTHHPRTPTLLLRASPDQAGTPDRHSSPGTKGPPPRSILILDLDDDANSR
jgi:hypothetical protein